MARRSIGGAGQSAAAGVPFRFVGGSAALDFVNTVNWTGRGLERERLEGYEALVRWGEEAGVLSAEEAGRYRDAGRRDPEGAAGVLAGAHALRDTLKRLFTAVAAGRAPEAEVLERFNASLAEAQARLFIAPEAGAAGGPAFGWRWRGMGEDPGGVLWPVVRAAAELLASEELGRLRACAGDDCGWLYVDRSRNGLRRWCEMRTCGNAAKSRRYYRRVRARRGEAG